MKTCREVARDVSESLDRKLPFWTRIGLWFHLAMCGICRRYVGQMRLLRRAIRMHLDKEHPSDPKLPEETRERIKKKMRES